jgi:hypothetical protein
VSDRPEPSLANPYVQTSRSQDFRDVYSNHNRLGVSPVDINITFSKIIESGIGINTIEDQAVIRMSAQQFKSFLDSATKTMAAWEEVFGEIKETVKNPAKSTMVDSVRRLKEALDKANG